MGANTRQIAGEHYKKYGDFQVWDAWWHWDLDAFQANVIKYVIRSKGDLAKRLEDLDKAQHYLQKYEELLRDTIAEQKEQLATTTWNLSPTQEVIIQAVVLGNSRGKLEMIFRVRELIEDLKETLVQEQK